MLAPASQLECFYYRTLAWQYKQSGKSKQWVKVAEESLHVPFFLDDGTGRLLVDCNGAETDLHRDFHEQYNQSFFSSNDSVPDGVYQLLARHGVSNDHDLKVDEYCIKPKNFLFVLGTLAENPGLELTAMPQHTQPPGVSVSLHLPGSSVVTERLSVSLGDSVTAPLQITTTPVDDPALLTSAASHTTGGADPQVVANALMKAGITNPRAWAAAGVNPADAHAQPSQILPGVVPPAAPHCGPADQQTVADALIKAGITSPRAWAAAGINNPGAFRAQTSSATQPSHPAGLSAGTAAAPAIDPISNPQSNPDPGFDPHPKTVLMRGENDRAFFISWRSQREVIASLGWKSALYIWGGPLLLLLSAYVLVERFAAL